MFGHCLVLNYLSHSLYESPLLTHIDFSNIQFNLPVCTQMLSSNIFITLFGLKFCYFVFFQIYSSFYHILSGIFSLSRAIIGLASITFASIRLPLEQFNQCFTKCSLFHHILCSQPNLYLE